MRVELPPQGRRTRVHEAKSHEAKVHEKIHEAKVHEQIQIGGKGILGIFSKLHFFPR
jgi:hypothetical protein